MPVAKVFADTNVLLYSHDPRDGRKLMAAREWLEFLASQGCGCTNLQVLNEAAHVLLRRRWRQSPAEVYAAVDAFRSMGAAPVTWVEVERARVLSEPVFCTTPRATRGGTACSSPRPWSSAARITCPKTFRTGIGWKG